MRRVALAVAFESRSQAPAWDRRSPKLRFAACQPTPSHRHQLRLLRPKCPCEMLEKGRILPRPAKQSFEERRPQAGAWGREGKIRLNTIANGRFKTNCEFCCRSTEWSGMRSMSGTERVTARWALQR